MKKALAISLATAGLLLAQGGAATYAQTPIVQGQTAKVTASALNVRTMPSVQGQILGKLPQHTTITVNGMINGWAKISYQGKTAYVNAQYIQPTTQAVQALTMQAFVTAPELNVRTQPSINGAIIGKLPKGAAVTIKQKYTNGWLQIAYNGKVAYINGAYVTTTKPSTTVPTKPTTSTSQLSAYELKVVELTNVERQKAGLNVLQIDTNLSKVARLKSEDMLKNNYFSHTSPTYGSPFDMMRANGITYRAAGENIAMGQRTPEEVVKAWMNSPGHRANILNNSFTHIGVGYVGEKNIWTQQFIGK
jgi:uncharacterized YkwD family protein